MNAALIPLEFPDTAKGLFVQVDKAREAVCRQYHWGLRFDWNTQKDTPYALINGKQRALASFVTAARGFQFRPVDGDVLNCQVSNLRCMNPRGYLRTYGSAYLGPSTNDADWKIIKANAELEDQINGKPRRRKTKEGEIPGYLY